MNILQHEKSIASFNKMKVRQRIKYLRHNSTVFTFFNYTPLNYKYNWYKVRFNYCNQLLKETIHLSEFYPLGE